jgi:hypothetical protein
VGSNPTALTIFQRETPEMWFAVAPFAKTNDNDKRSHRDDRRSNKTRT